MIHFNPPRPCVFGVRKHNPETKQIDLINTQPGLCHGFAQEDAGDGVGVVAVVEDDIGYIHTPAVWCTQFTPIKLPCKP